MKNILIHRVSYSPGYGDMLGGYHESILNKDKEGNWTFTCFDRNAHNEPTVTTTYEVSADSVTQFEEFIINKKILSLEKRPKSQMFAADYSPWSWRIDYETTSFGKAKRKYCDIGEYKIYTERDHKLLNDLKKLFIALHK